MAFPVSNQPWPVGQTYQLWGIPLMTDQGPDDLTDVDITKLTLYFRTLNGVETAGTGTFYVMQTYPAIVLYKPSVADVSTPFNGTIFIVGLYPPTSTTADEVIFDPVKFAITARGSLQ